MGMEWDPDGDAERSKESRTRLWLTIGIMLAIAAFAAKQIYKWQQEKRQRAVMEEIYRSPSY